MEKSLKYFLSLGLCSLLTCCASNGEKAKNASEFGFHFYQGSPRHMNAFAYALELDSTNAANWRELSVPYLKRGIPHKWKMYFDKAVAHDPETWVPWRGYLYLWFYRDYEKAIADFDASDTLTPHLDYPQGHSVDFWRGIAYLGLKDHDSSIAYWDRHISKETEDAGEDWVELEAFLYRGIAFYEDGNPEKALEDFNKVLHYFKQSADAHYYLARILNEAGQHEKALEHIAQAITDFNSGFYNNRPYVETLRQIYLQDLEALKAEIYS